MTFEYQPGAHHANADGMSRQCGQCQRPDCPVSAMDSPLPDAEPETKMVDQPFDAAEMGESMDSDLLPELSGETWVASALIKELMDSVGSYSGMGGVCWALPRITLLAITAGKSVNRHGRPIMAAPGAAGGGLTTGGPPE